MNKLLSTITVFGVVALLLLLVLIYPLILIGGINLILSSMSLALIPYTIESVAGALLVVIAIGGFVKVK